ncbi:MAG: hypothetical protein NC900_03295 [Candidatus Omnitrophica bacterium]|nr:hypothetical protein [Candidatus Omnitrophota bacterium]MCM8799743.1 hypothetical protein [Candidatus Omnitrophota bacterium]
MNSITWTKEAEETFKKILDHLPQFHRSIAQRLVKEKAEMIALERGLSEVSKQQLIEAFFQEVPPAFRQMMERLFHQLGIDFNFIKKEE